MPAQMPAAFSPVESFASAASPASVSHRPAPSPSANAHTASANTSVSRRRLRFCAIRAAAAHTSARRAFTASSVGHSIPANNLSFIVHPPRACAPFPARMPKNSLCPPPGPACTSWRRPLTHAHPGVAQTSSPSSSARNFSRASRSRHFTRV